MLLDSSKSAYYMTAASYGPKCFSNPPNLILLDCKIHFHEQKSPWNSLFVKFHCVGEYLLTSPLSNLSVLNFKL